MSTMRLKFAFEPTTGGVWGDEPKGDANDMVCVRVADFDDDAGRVSSDRLTVRNISSSEQKGRLLRHGDLLLEKSGGGEQTSVGRTVRFDHGFVAVCSNFIALLRPKSEHDPRFLTYLMRALYHGGGSVPHIKQTTGIQNLDCYSYLSRTFKFPVVAEQRRIAEYLDELTARIDRLMVLRRQQMELLREQRGALIQQAVTRGLDPNTTLKDSGIPWLGQIPRHWEMKLFKFVARRVDVGIAEAATHAYAESGIPIIRSTNVRPNRLDSDDLLFLEPWFAEKNRSKYLYAGDIVTTRTGNAGVSAVVPEPLDRCQCFTMLISTLKKNYSPDYFSYQMNSDSGRTYFQREAWGAAQDNISVPILKDMPVVVPPAAEQLSIVDFIRREKSKSNTLSNAYARQLTLLTEYRSALIHECVTGQRRIGEDVAQLAR